MIIKITVKGLVQGIGYRPFVAELAEELHIEGWVRNSAGVVTILAKAEKSVLEEFQNRLVSGAPIGSAVQSLLVEEAEDALLQSLQMDNSHSKFHIILSEETIEDHVLPRIPADLATCPRCFKEMHDSENRRYNHPFISCVACGPRYTILHALPYDREQITMRAFEMCEACHGEYVQKGNVRRHAQTIACKNCGPRLLFQNIGAAQSESFHDERALEEAISVLNQGGMVAIKDIGGYHLACRPDCAETLRALRLAKGREKKPFALMYATVEAVKEDCLVNDLEAQELESVARPIVLCRKKTEGLKDISENCRELICKNSPDIGAMLPCNPLQILLSEALGTLIMTSANASGEPMIIDDDTMANWLLRATKLLKDEPGDIPLAILSHQREILVPLDDSVLRIVRGRRQFVRRSRGYVPEPILIADAGASETVLAMGGDLKATFAIAKGNQVVPSGQMGDLEDLDCYNAYEKEIQRLQQLLRVSPAVMVTDLHPQYQSVKKGEELSEGHKLISLQHHMAHALSVIAEHQLQGEVICVTMDGTGYGTDQTIWGGEVFLWKQRQMTRIGKLQTQTLPGGDAGVKNAKSVAYAFLATLPEIPLSFWEHANWLSMEEFTLVKAAMQLGIHTAQSSSTGRLFDAVSALLGICLYNDYEGEAPMELEYCAGMANAAEGVCLHIPCVEQNGLLVGDTTALIDQIVTGISAGTNSDHIARAFIDALAEFIYDEVVWNASLTDTKQVALSGGTFLNRLLLEQTMDRLEADGYRVYVNEQVPTGDGGIALGQAYWALHGRLS